MKKATIILIIMTVGRLSYAQKETLALDEHQKYVYYQETDMPGITADTLYARSLRYLKKVYPKNSFKPAATTAGPIIIKDKLVVYNSNTIAKHEDGEINYTLNVEFKDAKYRYWLSDFIFKPYQRNRFGIFEPVAGIEYPFEKAKDKVDKRSFNIYMDQITRYSKALGDDLKRFEANPAKTEPKPGTVIIKKW